MQDHERLIVWQWANALAIDVVRIFTPRACALVPGFRNQLLRAAFAIPDLIAEGCGKESRLELARYSDMALGSAAEFRSQIRRARDLGIISNAVHESLDERVDRIRRMLTGLSRAVRRNARSSPRSPDGPEAPSTDVHGGA